MSATVHPSMSVLELDFDHKNPRLSEYDLGTNSTDSEIVKILWEAMDVRELVLSIAASGFFSHEPIIVSQEDGRNVVIEGNRRLAAVKVLLDPTLLGDSGDDIPVLAPEDKDKLLELPVLISTRKDAWQYLGFKHVNGPAKWSSYAKSQYIADVHREFGVPLEDIARQIGDTHRTVQRLFRGLMVIEQAERLGVFNREDRYNRHFSFSHLYTGIDYDGIASFIGLQPESQEKEEPIPPDKQDELRDVCLWLYGSKKEDRRPVIRSQNPDLRQLDEVLKSGEAVAALRAGRELSVAFEFSRPSSAVFEEALYGAKRDLEKARSLVSTGYGVSDLLLRVANDVAELALDLYDDMSRKHSPRGRRKAEKDN